MTIFFLLNTAMRNNINLWWWFVRFFFFLIFILIILPMIINACIKIYMVLIIQIYVERKMKNENKRVTSIFLCFFHNYLFISDFFFFFFKMYILFYFIFFIILCMCIVVKWWTLILSNFTSASCSKCVFNF